MTKRTNQTKTTIYRRHAATCPVAGQPNNVTNCECPLWIHGKIRGQFIRQSLDTRTLSTAERRQNDLEDGHNAAGPVLVTRKAGAETLEYAIQEFMETRKGLSTSSQTLYRRAVEHFGQFAAKQELVLLRDVEATHVRQYFDANRDWKRNTAAGRLTHLRVFFNFCRRDRRWLTFTPTEDSTLLNGSRKSGTTRSPFTPDQITQIFAAVERMPADIRDRARAIIYLMLFTGMRISDATFCEREYLTPEGNMDYFVIKTRRPISLPPELQEPAIAALKKLPKTRVYFFQPDAVDDYRDARQSLRDGDKEFSDLMPHYKQRIVAATELVLRVLTVAGIKGTCHKFRDTFAINMLVGGTDIFTVSQALGHSDVKITQKHYMKLVPGYRERMSKATRVLAYRFPIAAAS